MRKRQWWSEPATPTYPVPGTRWTTIDAGFNTAWSDLALGFPNGRPRLVAVGNTGTNRFAYSDNGITFTAGVTPQTSSWRGVCWSETDECFYAVSQDGAQRVAQSTDGINWTLLPAVPVAQYHKIAEAPGFANYLCASCLDNVFAYSSDGNTFALSNVVTGSHRNIAYGNGVLASIDISVSAGFRAARSVNGNAWTAVATPAPDSNWRGIAYSPRLGRWVAGGGTALYYMYSDDDAQSWVAGSAGGADTNTSDVVWCDEIRRFVSIGSSGTSPRAAQSEDGITFSPLTGMPTQSWQALAWVPYWGPRGKLVAAAFNGLFATSG